MPAPRSDNPVGIPRSVLKALNLLDLFSERHPWLGLSEIAELAGLPKGTAQRLLLALEQAGFVFQDPESRKWGLGFKIVGLYHTLRHTVELYRVVNPWMHKLRDMVEETVFLVVEDSGDGITIDRVDPIHNLRLQVPLGIREPMHAGASRKVLLAFMPDESRERIMAQKGLRQITVKTITDPDQVRLDLANIRRQGYAMTEGEHNAGVASVAAPVLGASGYAVASMSVAGPSQRFSADKVLEALPKLLQITAQVSQQLGYRGNSQSSTHGG